jgi:hypothetical protein
MQKVAIDDINRFSHGSSGFSKFSVNYSTLNRDIVLPLGEKEGRLGKT